MNAPRMLAIVTGLQASLDVLREELEKELGIERRAPGPPPRREPKMPPIYGRRAPEEPAPDPGAAFQRLQDAAAAAPSGTAESPTDTPKE